MSIKHICLIDDDEIAALLVSGLLKRLDKPQTAIQLSSFPHGRAALDGLSHLPKASFPDLILLDLGMPVMDGHQFLKHYTESLAGNNPQTKIVVLTSSLLKQDRMVVEQYDFVKDFIVKPLLLTQLKTLIEINQSD